MSTVEIDTDEGPEKAWELAMATDEASPSACASCSNDFDLTGTVIGGVVCNEDGGKELLKIKNDGSVVDLTKKESEA